MESTITVKTGAWYGDKQIDLQIPSGWDVNVLLPATPPPLTDEELDGILERPVGQGPLSEILKGKSRPLIIVDDLNRPTPASVIMPLLLRKICAENIRPENITILMATGTHGKPGPDAILKKVGKEAASCRLLVHDCFADLIKIGTTAYGTPVFVNKAILDSDVIIGISGIYPNHTAGFSGGSKLALGVLGIRSIYHLHFCHKAVHWGYPDTDTTFRRDLDEIAVMIGMKINVSLIIDSNRNIIRMFCGDQRIYFAEAVSFYLKTFRTLAPDDADVVISNSYPNDLSLTFTRMKGFVPLNGCRRDASRISIASCDEGLGLHNVWPFVNVPQFHRAKHVLRILSVMSFREIISRIQRVSQRRLAASLKKWSFLRPRSSDELKKMNPVWLYRTGDQAVMLPPSVPGINITLHWPEIVEAIRREQADRHDLRVLVYPCAFLQLPQIPNVDGDK
ncbi:MAG TPA: lactate racemase domain-containing protein [Geobacteraceae bacterium]|nr:lactate racemase domain-containing protein [Geobacteraceae bacterium]